MYLDSVVARRRRMCGNGFGKAATNLEEVLRSDRWMKDGVGRKS